MSSAEKSTRAWPTFSKDTVSIGAARPRYRRWKYKTTNGYLNQDPFFFTLLLFPECIHAPYVLQNGLCRTHRLPPVVSTHFHKAAAFPWHELSLGTELELLSITHAIRLPLVHLFQLAQRNTGTQEQHDVLWNTSVRPQFTRYSSSYPQVSCTVPWSPRRIATGCGAGSDHRPYLKLSLTSEHSQSSSPRLVGPAPQSPLQLSIIDTAPLTHTGMAISCFDTQPQHLSNPETQSPWPHAHNTTASPPAHSPPARSRHSEAITRVKNPLGWKVGEVRTQVLNHHRKLRRSLFQPTTEFG